MKPILAHLSDAGQDVGARRNRSGRKRHGFRPNRRDDRRVPPKPPLYDPQVPGRYQMRAELRAARLARAV